MITVETKRATQDIKAGFRSLSGDNVKTATSRAINHTLAKARTAVSKEIRSVYKIAAGDVKDATSLKRSTTSTLTGQILASASPISLSKFNPIQNRGNVQVRRVGGKKGGFASSKLKRAGSSGVTIEVIKGKKETLPSAFLKFAGSGKATVMARGEYDGKNFDWGRSRLPISKLNTKSVYWASQDKNIMASLVVYVQDKYAKRLVHELTTGLDSTRIR